MIPVPAEAAKSIKSAAAESKLNTKGVFRIYAESLFFVLGVLGKEGLHMKMLKELKWEAILTGVLYILLGIVALVIPETMQKTLGYLIGIVLIVAGLISIICYLLRDARENYYHNEFVFGILGIVLGAVVLYKVEIVISLIPFILGVLVLCSGCSKLQDAIDLKRLGYGSWLGLLIVAAINIILGVVLIYNPFKAAILLFRVLGVVLILSGAGDCFSTIYFARKLRRFKQEQDRYVGVVSEGDFLWNILSHNSELDSITMKSLEKLSIRDIIQNGKIRPVCIDTNMEELLGQAQMQNFVPVIDDRNVFIGIITRSEIIKYFIKKQIEVAEKQL